MAPLVYPKKFTVGDERPRLGLKTKLPDPVANGYDFQLLLEQPDGTCVVIPSVNISSDNKGGVYRFPWLLGAKSLVNLDVVLDPGFALPAGFIFQNALEEEFQTTASITNATAFQATFPVAAESVLDIAADVSPGAVSIIPTPAAGLISVTNPAAGVTGTPASLVEGDMQCLTVRVVLPSGGTQHLDSVLIDVNGRPCP